MMLAQQEMISRLRRLCQEDERVVAAMLYGSFAWDEADRYSDIDCILYFADERLPEVDQAAWLAQIAPLEQYYHNEFGNGVAIFDNLVRGEFHFDPLSKMADLADFQGRLTFPSLEATVLVDKTGQLAAQLLPLIGPPLERDTAEEVQYLAHSFLNWMLFGLNVLARGEYARTLEILSLVHDHLLRLARLEEGQIQHWMTPTRNLEAEISPETYRKLAAASAGLDPATLRVAYQAAWHWGLVLLPEPMSRHGLEMPDSLVDKMARHLQIVTGG